MLRVGVWWAAVRLSVVVRSVLAGVACWPSRWLLGPVPALALSLYAPPCPLTPFPPSPYSISSMRLRSNAHALALITMKENFPIIRDRYTGYGRIRLLLPHFAIALPTSSITNGTHVTGTSWFLNLASYFERLSSALRVAAPLLTAAVSCTEVHCSALVMVKSNAVPWLF